MAERRFTNHAVRPKTDAIYTTPTGILRLSPHNRTAKVLLFSHSTVIGNPQSAFFTFF